MPRRRTGALPAPTVVLMACMALNASPAVAQAPPIEIQSRAEQWLLTGSPDDPYWVIDNRWGQGSIPAGAFSQGVGGGSSAEGRVAFRMQWQWPQGDTEVKGYPAALYGRKPGYSGYTASLLRSAGLASSNGPATAGLFPLKLPVTPVKAHVVFQHNSQPTGQGQLTFDLWLQSDARQDNGWLGSSITHEIMIPLDLWGNYGAHQTAGGRNPGWYDHDATIAGKLYHVYITKDGDGCSRYNFGSLNGAYGKTGWKLIAFVPAELPVGPGEIDLAAIVNHVATRKDACGEPWARGDEYLVSAELGVEPVLGTGDISVYDYKLSNTGVTATGTTVVVPARPLGGGGSNAGPGGGGGGNANGGGGNGNGGNGGNAGNGGNGGNDGGGNAGGGNAGGGNGGNGGNDDDDAKKGKDKYHKYEKDGSRFDKNGNKSRPVTARPRAESTEGTAPGGSTAAPPAGSTTPPPATGSTATPPAASTPPAAGATLPPPAGAAVPPATGSVVPPPAGATLPPPAGATVPPPPGTTLPPAAGATLQPATGATPAPATATPPSATTPPPATSTPPAAGGSTAGPPAAQTEPAAAPTTQPAAETTVPVPTVPVPTASTAPPSTGAGALPPAESALPTSTVSAQATDERNKASPRNPRSCDDTTARPAAAETAARAPGNRGACLVSSPPGTS